MPTTPITPATVDVVLSTLTIQPTPSSTPVPSSSTSQPAPTGPPKSAAMSKMPEINGSSGGFIALIVCLILIIIVSCGAVFYLLRNHEPSKRDRELRRARTHHYQQRANDLASSSPFNYSASDTSTPQSLKDRVTGALRIGRGVRGQGWTQAASGDDWEVRGEGADRHLEHAGPSPPVGVSFAAPPSRSRPDSPSTAEAYREMESASSVHVDLYSPGSAYAFPNQSRTPDRVASPTRHVSVTGSMRSESPDVLSSPEGAYTPIRESSRHMSTQSGMTIRTFEGGTKFIEELDH
ncbi:hypothetical protein PLICRDRAFT_53820 [Plicaturopsis crispa FD-325 SS-3]|nr:hypothetical protein PLICRDRAFT_53820 [Plicaturopsis crispa FD-325 SS-3]